MALVDRIISWRSEEQPGTELGWMGKKLPVPELAVGIRRGISEFKEQGGQT